jgi:phospholipid/cholesterol/gamma-HCH transport system ATP-binding protein
MSRTATKPVIEFKGIHFSYTPGTPILRGVDLAVASGEVLVILGGSGSGKSTILRLILGLLDADSGQIYFEGEDITNAKGDALIELRHKMGMVFQEGALFDSLTVGENVGYYLLEHGMDNARDLPEVERRVKETLALVGLEHTMDKFPGELSGGMRRRVAAARTLIYSPDLILYDEPTTGLDPATCENFCKVMNDIKREKGVASIMVTHNMEDALEVGDKFLLLRNGVPFWTGTSEQLKAQPKDFLLDFFRNNGTGAA